MYLEISARQTGKTTRLLEFAFSKARKQETVCIVVDNQSMANHLASMVVNMSNEVIAVEGGSFKTPLRNFITITANIGTQRGYKHDWYCYDEFDFNTKIPLSSIVNNSYFTSSPRAIRTKYQRSLKSNDLLYHLVRKKRGKYVQRVQNIDTLISMIDSGLPRESILIEGLGVWSDDQIK